MGFDDVLAKQAHGLWAFANDFRLSLECRWVRGGAVGRGPRGSNQVALTFDDGPDPNWTPAILDHLNRFGAQASFFQVGAAMEKLPDIALAVQREGHAVGTHLFSHNRHPGSAAEFRQELTRAFDCHERILSCRPRFLRFPFGNNAWIRQSDLDSQGLRAVHWTFSSLDSRLGLAREVAKRVTRHLRPGDIVLLHDGRASGSRLGVGNRQATVEALPEILAFIAAKGWRAVTLDDLLTIS